MQKQSEILLLDCTCSILGIHLFNIKITCRVCTFIRRTCKVGHEWPRRVMILHTARCLPSVELTRNPS